MLPDDFSRPRAPRELRIDTPNRPTGLVWSKKHAIAMARAEEGPGPNGLEGMGKR